MNLKKYFYQEIWNIGIYQKDGNFGLTTLPTICNDTQIYWLTERFHFQADPFLVEHDNQLFVFYEALNHTWIKGQLRCRVLDLQLNELEDFALEDINKLGCHLSFPQVYFIDGQFYLIPESHENHAIYLFKAIDFPKKWQKITTIATSESIDSVLYQQTYPADTPRYWIISNDKKTLQRQLFTSHHLTANWQAVPLSSDLIEADNVHQRLGGGVIELNELNQSATQQYLPMQQNHPKEYGKSLFIKQISLPTLAQNSPQPLSAWQESTLFEMVSHSMRYPDGIHTLNISDNFVIIDAKRWAFQPFNFFVRKFRQLKQLLSK